MAFAAKPALAGQLPVAAAVLCTATAESLYVQSITLANRSAVGLAVSLFHRVGGVNFMIFNETIAAGAVVTGGKRLLADGEAIWGVAASAASVDYVISRVSET